MRIRKFNLISVSLLFIFMLFGCSNKSEEHNINTYISSNTESTNISTNLKVENNVSHTTTTTVSTTTMNKGITVDETTTSIVTTTIEFPTTIVTSTAVETSAIVEISTIESAIDTNEFNIPTDSLIIKNNTIFLTYGIPEQDLIDNSDVVYDTGRFTNEFNTVLFGHFYNSFGVLDSVEVGEIIWMNEHDCIKKYEVTRSERAYLCSEGKEVKFLSDDQEIIKNDFGYHGLILFTCDKEDYYNYRWIVVAKEIV